MNEEIKEAMDCPKCGAEIEPQNVKSYIVVLVCDKCGYDVNNPPKSNKENCCVISCGKKAKYQIGDKGKPLEPTFICEEHKETVAHDWIEEITKRDCKECKGHGFWWIQTCELRLYAKFSKPEKVICPKCKGTGKEASNGT